MSKGRRRKLQSKLVEGEWFIPSMEAPSFAFKGKPKAIERELAEVREHLLARTQALRSQGR